MTSGKISQQRLPLKLGPRSGAVRRVHAGRSAGGRSLSDGHDAGDADRADEREQQKKRALGQQGRHALGAHAADETSERRRPCHARHQRLRRMRVEPLVEQGPERGDRNPAQHAGVQVEEHRRRPRLRAEKQPLDQEQCRVRRNDRGNRPRRAQPGQQPSGEVRGDDREHGRSRDEIGEALNLEERQEQPVADGVSANLLRDERRRGQRRDQVWLPIDHDALLPTRSSSPVTSTRASSYS